jgi:serine/threonine protein kinase
MELESVPFDESALEYNKGDFELELNGGGGIYSTLNFDEDYPKKNPDSDHRDSQSNQEEDQSKNYNWVKVIG